MQYSISLSEEQRIKWLQSLLKANAPLVFNIISNKLIPTKAEAPDGSGDEPLKKRYQGSGTQDSCNEIEKAV